MEISMELIKQLREKSGAGISDCKTALEETKGDLEKAFDVLRKKGIAKLAKRADKSTNAGFIGTYLHNGQVLGVAVLCCETDFVARGEVFMEMARNMAMQVCSQAPLYANKEDVPAADLEREKSIFEEELKKSGKPAEIIEKMMEGKLQKFYEQTVLMEMVYIKDESKKVKDLLDEVVSKTGEKIIVKEVARITI